MGKSLNEIAKELKNNNKKVKLIYAFNGTGKTRLSKEFKNLIQPRNLDTEETNDDSLKNKKILYYNAFTEDLFYWDNDLVNDVEPKLTIRSNAFINWVFIDQGQDSNVIDKFQKFTNEKLTPTFNFNYTEVKFSYQRGNVEIDENIKISKGEESCFIWSVFFSLLEQVIEVLNIDEDSINEERSTDQFDNLEYIFIDDPVSSLDDNHLIELAVELAGLIKSSKSNLKFIITTHNPLFYNVLFNELGNADKYLLEKLEDVSYTLNERKGDSPFAYHIFLMKEIENAIAENRLKKYHYNYLRNILEKTSTFLGYGNWSKLLPNVDGEVNPYEARIINISSHSKHSAEEIVYLNDEQKKVLKYLYDEFKRTYKFEIKNDSNENTLKNK